MTREFDLRSQRVDLKTNTMTAWTEVLMTSYTKGGGKYLMPTETGCARKLEFCRCRRCTRSP